jgi:hypothetical protein
MKLNVHDQVKLHFLRQLVQINGAAQQIAKSCIRVLFPNHDDDVGHGMIGGVCNVVLLIICNIKNETIQLMV